MLTLPLLLTVQLAAAQAPIDLSPPMAAIVGEETNHVVQSGDTLASLAARYGVDQKVLIAENALKGGASLTPGRTLRIVARHILPTGAHDGILINIPQRHLFFFRNGTLIAHYPVAVGKPDWRTPTGEFHVAVKETDPTWEVPKSIQQEMRRTGKRVVTSVPPGPDNPLGQYWIGLNRTSVGIHGTNSPRSIYHSATHGCVRMHPDDIEALFSQVELNTPVTIIYEPVLLTAGEDGIYVEAHADVYRKGDDPLSTVRRLAAEAGLQSDIDWTAVTRLLAKREGVARGVSVRNPN